MSYKELRAKTGEDKDGKPFYKTIGRLMDTSKGPMIKLDVVPCAWDGWAFVSDPLPKDRQQQRGNSSHDDDGPPF